MNDKQKNRNQNLFCSETNLRIRNFPPNTIFGWDAVAFAMSRVRLKWRMELAADSVDFAHKQFENVSIFFLQFVLKFSLSFLIRSSTDALNI